MLRLRIALAVVLLAVAASGATAASTAHAGTRLRPQSTRIRTWLAYGLKRSPTMRALAERIEASDVVVYLDVQRTLGPNVAACVTWIASVPGARYVRVSVRPELRMTDAAAMIAHELQHVIEVVEHPDVHSDADLDALYRRIGHRTGSSEFSWDTLAALRIGGVARSEMASGV